MISIVHNADYKNVISEYDKYDWVITDVPYGIDAGNMPFINHRNTVTQKDGYKIMTPSKDYKKDNWDNEPPKQDNFDEIKRISKNQIIFGIEYVNWVGVGEGRIKWNKGVPEGMSFKKYEMAYCSSINYEYQLDYLWAGMMQGKSPLEPMVMQGNKKLNEKRIHPCHKPIIMWLIMLNKFCKQGDKIFDSHMGSGSLRIACDIFGCNYVGCEINSDIFIRHEKRWSKYKSQQRIQFNSTEPHQE